MADILNIVPSTTLLYLAALFVYTLCVKKLTAFSFIFVGVLILEILHVGLEFYLYSSNEYSSYYELVYYSWYIGFAATDFLFIWVACLWSRKAQVPFDTISKVVLWLHGFMGVIQIVRLVERSYIDSYLMSLMYSNSIVLINMIIALLLIGFVAKVILENLRQSFRSL
ncbi:hypothetical protein CA267_017025 [Alteromonas pelagimontana]|uniref:Uncharacterized protein n=1 Tax=Alteromonas pelagimontana TaxID=1858656 RepID=A0A6M4MH09_9ALTE|nr:hypothetical protein [Alteromonas pelagimontana]QJR82332.1 hypothetical protein CA267_017025 [Alteromonas pelagimontana]